MADSNFIDYVKIHCTSGAGGAGSTHMLRTKGNAKAAQTVETADAVATLFCAVTLKCGPFCT